MKIRSLVFLKFMAVLVACASYADAGILANYDFDAGAINPFASRDADVHSSATLFTPNTGVSGFGIGTSPAQSPYGPGGLSNPQTGNGLAATNTSLSVNLAQTPSSPAGNYYFEFKVSASELDLSSLAVDFRRDATGGSGPATATVAIYSDVDGFASSIGASTITSTNAATSWATIPMDLGDFDTYGNDFQNIQDSITFRVYFYDNRTSGTYWLDNVILEGSALPEPASLLAWAGLSAVGGVLALRRRKARQAAL